MTSGEVCERTTVTMDGTEIPADVIDALAHLDQFFRQAADRSAPLAERSRERGTAVAVAEYARRTLTAGVARVIGAAERDADFADDGHRAVRPWVNAHVNTSRTDAVRDVQIAALGREHPVVIELLAAGSLGVAQARQLALVHANPRVGESFAAALPHLLELATDRTYDDFLDKLRRWTQAADADGSHRDHDAAHQGRRAHASTVGSTTYLDAAVGTYQGAELIEILDRFTDAQFRAEWDDLKAIHGDDMCVGLLRRTPAQRRADALVEIFRTAALAGPGVTSATSVVVNIVISQPLYEEQLAALFQQRAPRFDTMPDGSYCETTSGIPIDPADAVAASLLGHVRRVVVDQHDVVIGFGRRRRLFTGAARDAAAVQFLLQTGGRCTWAGCGHRRVETDHTDPHAEGGETELRNAGPLCGWHNRIKNRGYRTWRDRHGRWRTTRPDGTPIDPM